MLVDPQFGRAIMDHNDLTSIYPLKRGVQMGSQTPHLGVKRALLGGHLDPLLDPLELACGWNDTLKPCFRGHQPSQHLWAHVSTWHLWCEVPSTSIYWMLSKPIWLWHLQWCMQPLCTVCMCCTHACRGVLGPPNTHAPPLTQYPIIWHNVS